MVAPGWPLVATAAAAKPPAAFDAAVRGCIPAVLSDPVSFPFERLLDFRAFSLKLPERWAPRLAAELRATSAAALGALHAALWRVWPAFSYKQGGCAYEMILLELALRRRGAAAAAGLRAYNSPTAFWTPSRGRFVLRNATKGYRARSRPSPAAARRGCSGRRRGRG